MFQKNTITINESSGSEQLYIRTFVTERSCDYLQLSVSAVKHQKRLSWSYSEPTPNNKNAMPIQPAQLKKLRRTLGLTQQQAADVVLVTKRSWQNWETEEGKENHRIIPEGSLELFCLKTKVAYKIVDKKVHIVLP